MHASVQHLQRSAILNQIRFFRGHRLACKVAQQYSSTSPQVAGGTDVVQETARALRGELRRMFETGDITPSMYAEDIVFEDPITRFTNLAGYKFMIQALHNLFTIKFDLHDVQVTQPDQITTRWTMSMKVWELPWQPTLLFSGRSFYQVNPISGIITEHKDVWDSVDNDSFFSTEAALLVVQQLLSFQQTPNLETPDFTVLRATKQYEIRRYDPYIVAETPMAQGSTPAGGSGFTDLAGYIFGGNADNAKMEMTTPVFTKTAAQAASSSRVAAAATSSSAAPPSMQFVIERKFPDVDTLPRPNNINVTNKQQEGRFVAAVRFSGWPLDFEVEAAERQLRTALLRDGLQPSAGYTLARYNEPLVPPFLRRNEVLIDLQDFQWP